MVLVLTSYSTDIGKKYAFLPISLSFRDNNNEPVTTDISFVDFLPDSYHLLYQSSQFSCQESLLIPRKVKVYLNNPSINITFPFPVVFNLDLFTYLANDSRVKAFEFIGETVKHSKLNLIV
ncbi:MAG: hypothetical protein ACRDBG_07870 [Waterburya sp.]